MSKSHAFLSSVKILVLQVLFCPWFVFVQFSDKTKKQERDWRWRPSRRRCRPWRSRRTTWWTDAMPVSRWCTNYIHKSLFPHCCLAQACRDAKMRREKTEEEVNELGNKSKTLEVRALWWYYCEIYSEIFLAQCLYMGCFPHLYISTLSNYKSQGQFPFRMTCGKASMRMFSVENVSNIWLSCHLNSENSRKQGTKCCLT